jgi:hypothetical protein
MTDSPHAHDGDYHHLQLIFLPHGWHPLIQPPTAIDLN